MKTSQKRQEELERLLRKLRRRAFDCDRCAGMIHVVKRRLSETWETQAKALENKRMSNWMM